MTSTNSATFYCNDFEVTVVGYEIDGGWRVGAEIRKGDKAEVIRDVTHVYTDFNSGFRMIVLAVHQKISTKLGL